MRYMLKKVETLKKNKVDCQIVMKQYISGYLLWKEEM